MLALNLVLLILTLASICSSYFKGNDIEVMMSLLSGHFSNEIDLEHLADIGIKTKQNVINVFFRALRIPSMQLDRVMYFEKYVDDVLYLQQIHQYVQKSDIIGVRQFNFTHPEKFLPGTFSISDLESLTKDDLKASSECDAFARRVDETVFLFAWPDCTRPNEILGEYSITVTCKTATFISPKDTFYEAASKLPYVTIKVESSPIPESIFPGYEDYMKLCNM